MIKYDWKALDPIHMSQIVLQFMLLTMADSSRKDPKIFEKFVILFNYYFSIYSTLAFTDKCTFDILHNSFHCKMPKVI